MCSRSCQAVCGTPAARSEEHTSELQSRFDLVCRLLLEKKNSVVHHRKRLVTDTGHELCVHLFLVEERTVEVVDLLVVFFFSDAATDEIYTLSLHDALPIWHTSC